AHVYDPTIGVASIAWDPWSTGLDPALPWDQSGDDARALAFTSASLDAPLELIGSAAAILDITTSAPLSVVAKLADVAPSGRWSRSAGSTSPSATARAAGRRSSRAIAIAWKSRSARRPTGSRRDTGSASASPAPTFRGSGRPRRRASSTFTMRGRTSGYRSPR